MNVKMNIGMIRNLKRITICMFFATATLADGIIQGAITAQHTGLNNPSGEGFTLYHGTQSGGADVLPYWQIASSSDTGAAYINNVGGWSDPTGWTANMVAKVVAGPTLAACPSRDEAHRPIQLFCVGFAAAKTLIYY